MPTTHRTKVFRRSTFLGASLVGGLLICSGLGLKAQTKKHLTPQQENGEGLYLRNCSYCHSPRKAESPASIKGVSDNPKNPIPGVPIGPLLRDVVKGLPDQAVRIIIMQGSPDKMPGFQYMLDAKQVDDVISYLKTL